MLRTPLLPFDTLLEWSEGLAAPRAAPADLAAAIEADRALLRRRLAALIARPEIGEALFLASPSLHEALESWRRDPDGKKGRRCEAALVRYVVRMAARATPFGLFAGTCVGGVGEVTRIELAERSRYRRSSRLDMDYVFALADELERQPALRRELRFYPNSSLYRAAGTWHLVEVRFRQGWRTCHLVKVESSEYLDALIERAAAGARPGELTELLVEMLGADADAGEEDTGKEVAGEEDATDEDAGAAAAAFVDELIDSQILVSDLAPPVTGAEPGEALIARLETLAEAAPAAARLAEVRDVLARLDEDGPGADPEVYRAAARRLDELPRRPELRTLYQVDLFTPAVHATLGPEVLAEVRRGVDLLRRTRLEPSSTVLDRFREAFVNRYGEGRYVPLTEVLDEESGIGFQRSTAPGADASPLLADLPFGGEPVASPGWGEREEVLLRRLEAAWAEGAAEIELTAADVERLTREERPPPPDAFDVVLKLAARSPAALERGEFRLLLSYSGGPSGVRLLGRFCHGDAELRREIEAHLRAEEACGGDEVFAEIVHLPQGRLGNVIARPVLRDFEIPFLGRSGAPPERQILLTDLLLTVKHGRVELVSARSGRRISPRLSTAHNYEGAGLAPYRLLCFLQGQGLQGGATWSWGAFEGAAFLPAVRSGRLVLSLARWRVTEEELAPLVRSRGAERFRAVERWRAARRLPRWAAWRESDHELAIDFDNVLSIDAFLDGCKGRPFVILREVFPAPDELVVRGPEGGFTHEIVIPMVRGASNVTARPAPKPQDPRRRTVERRSFPPGSEWLYAKLYAGTATVDRVLTDAVASVLRRAADAIESWFFLRYGDPDWHLRVRFRGDPAALSRTVLPELMAAAAPLRAAGSVHRLTLDTYEREVERYGGPAAMLLVEEIFAADSAAVLRIVESLIGDSGAEARWRLTLLGLDRLLADWGASADEKLLLIETLRDETAKMLGTGKPLRLQLDRRFRDLRGELAALLTPSHGSDELDAGRAAFAVRSEQTAPIWAALRRLEAGGELSCPLREIVISLLHMHVNRLARFAGREHELVLYDFLYRLYKSARERGAETSASGLTRTFSTRKTVASGPKPGDRRA
ncbi:MAG TPA: lantibiotic dehydratase [Thermoanaerobaculia bacterium]